MSLVSWSEPRRVLPKHLAARNAARMRARLDRLRAEFGGSTRIQQCIAAAALAFERDAAELTGRRHFRHLARPRFAAAWLARAQGASLSEIGRRMKRDHTTILHAVRRARELMEADEDFARRVGVAESVIGDRLSVISDRSSVIGDQLSVIGGAR